MDFKVYLSGPITGLTYNESEDWRYQFASMLHPSIQTLSPLRGKKILTAAGALQGSYDHFPASTAKAIMGRDRFDTTRSDAVVVNLLGATKVSIGTVMEIAWADLHRVPIVLIIEKTGNIHEHPMLSEAITYRVETLKDAVHFTEVLLLPDQLLGHGPIAKPQGGAARPLNTGQQLWGGR